MNLQRSMSSAAPAALPHPRHRLTLKQSHAPTLGIVLAKHLGAGHEMSWVDVATRA